MADLTPEAVRLALRDCYDPQLPCNLVDLGALRDVTVHEDTEAPGASIPGVPPRFRVHVALAPPAPEDDAAVAQLLAQVANRLAGIPSISHAAVVISTAHPWSPAHITPAGRRILGLDGNRTLVQIR